LDDQRIFVGAQRATPSSRFHAADLSGSMVSLATMDLSDHVFSYLDKCHGK
jgi:hypothetical protein